MTHFRVEKSFFMKIQPTLLEKPIEAYEHVLTFRCSLSGVFRLSKPFQDSLFADIG